MAIGYMVVEINEKGEGRVKRNREGDLEMGYIDTSYEDMDYGTNEPFEMIAEGMPEGLKNVLLMLTFGYESSGGGSFYSDDYEHWFTVETHQILKEDYKEFCRAQITSELDRDIGGFKGLEAMPDGEDGNYYKNLIGNWEEFYDEDFEPYVAKPLVIAELLLN